MKLHEIAGSKFPTTKQEVIDILYNCRIYNYEINDDLTVNVNGDVDISNRTFSQFPVKFGKVTGFFNCDDCPNLSSLEGAPSSVWRYFSCIYCPNLKSLVGISEILVDVQGVIHFTWKHIKNGGLGLLQSGASGLGEVDTAPFLIIRKYLGTDNIIECQSELIEAGYEDYAVL